MTDFFDFWLIVFCKSSCPLSRRRKFSKILISLHPDFLDYLDLLSHIHSNHASDIGKSAKHIDNLDLCKWIRKYAYFSIQMRSRKSQKAGSMEIYVLEFFLLHGRWHECLKQTISQTSKQSDQICIIWICYQYLFKIMQAVFSQ